MRGFSRASIAALAAFSAAGCANWINDNMNFNGAQQVAIQDDSVRRVDLAQVISEMSSHPIGIAPDEPDETFWTSNCDPTAGVQKGDKGRACLEIATKRFYADTTDQRGRRNAIQARLLAASQAECLQFTQHLNTMQAFGNLTLGSIATDAGAVGAMVTDAPSARILSGVAAAATGSRAEFNSDMFYKEAAPVIVAAIKTSQDGFLRDVITPGRKLEIADYPLWSAIGDAFRYDDMCSLVGGLNTLTKDTVLAESPGLDAVNRTLLKVNTARAIADGNQVDSSVLNTDATGNSALLEASGALPMTWGSATDPEQAYLNAVQVLSAQSARAKTVFGDLATHASSTAQQYLTDSTSAVGDYASAALVSLGECKNPSLNQHHDALEGALNVTQDEASKLAYDQKKYRALVTAQSVQAYSSAVVQRINLALLLSPTIPNKDTVLNDTEWKGMLDNIKTLLAVSPGAGGAPAVPAPGVLPGLSCS